MRRPIIPVAVQLLAGNRFNSSRAWSPVAAEDEATANTTHTSSVGSSSGAADSSTGNHAKPLSEADRWWPKSQQPSQFFNSLRQRNEVRDKQFKDGLLVTEMKEVPSPLEPVRLADEDYDIRHKLLALDTVFEHEKKFIAPPTFDPALDDVDETMHQDGEIAAELNAAMDHDRKRLEAFSNPVTVESQVEMFLAPQRHDEKNAVFRQDFNGFSHWGLLHGAMIALEEMQDYKKAHQLVNRYMRDQDLFVAWLKHPKVVGHMDKKFGVDISESYDKLMGLAMSMYIRGKIQAFEGDIGGSLKSLTACTSLINEGGDIESNERHRKVLGATLAARGAVFVKLKSFERANEDFTKALNFVPAQRAASLFQMRAEAREQLGLIEEARRDEEHAADIWETADVITPGMDGAPRKFVI